jgi:hypothetical protein
MRIQVSSTLGGLLVLTAWEAMESVPHHLHLFRIRPTKSSSSGLSPANCQNRLTPWAKDLARLSVGVNRQY